MIRCNWARPSCMCCGMKCSLVVSVWSLSRTSVWFVVYRVYPDHCSWLMAAWCHGDCGLEKWVDGS